VCLIGEGRKGRKGGRFIYVWGGPEGAWRRRHTSIGDGPVVGVAAEEGYSIRYFLGLEGRTFM